MRNLLSSLLVVLCLGSALPAQTGCSGMALGIGASLNGFIPFPADNLWNQNIATAPVDPNSDAIINFIGATTPLHPDFGSGLYGGQSIGIPYIVVSGSPLVKIDFTAYGDESDPGPMPVPANAPVEGYPKPGDGDRHVLVLDRDNCWLYELYNSHLLKNGSWDAGSAAMWDLLDNESEQRPYTWTSADAAGLAIFPGLALRRICGGRYPARVAFHAEEQPGGVYSSGEPLGGKLDEPFGGADGHALAFEGKLRHFGISRAVEGDSCRPAAIRNDHGGQRQLDVHHRSAGRSLGQQRPRSAENGAGLGV
jgi:hypothetical protein